MSELIKENSNRSNAKAYPFCFLFSIFMLTPNQQQCNKQTTTLSKRNDNNIEIQPTTDYKNDKMLILYKHLLPQTQKGASRGSQAIMSLKP